MSDIFIPGVRSRFNTDQLIEDLMRVERIPLERTERDIENLQAQRSHWQELGRRITALRDSARTLYSFQNPFNERRAISADESILTASATRRAGEHDYQFTVKQLAAADRFISAPIPEGTQIESGTFTFTIGSEEISFNFRGGTVQEFVEAVNRRNRDLLTARLVSVQGGTRSLVLESRVTGAENRLGFSGDTPALMLQLGLLEETTEARRNIPINEDTIRASGFHAGNVNISQGALEVPAGASVSINVGRVYSAMPIVLRLQTLTSVIPEDDYEVEQPSLGPSVLQGSLTYGGIIILNDPSSAPFSRVQLQPQTPIAAPQRIDSMAALSLTFSDGSRALLPEISDSDYFQSWEYQLADIARGRTIVSLNVHNTNTHRDISVQNIELFNPEAVLGEIRPVNAISTARDSLISLEGIEMSRSSNEINDIIPGVTLNLRGVSERPVRLRVGADVEAVKDAIISFVGNYNRLMAEINVVTSSDPRLVDELTYLTQAEAAEMRERSGAFIGDSTLNSFRNSLQRIVSSPFPTRMERDLSMLSQIGISTNVRSMGGSLDSSRLRGYLEIDEQVLDAALENNLMAVRDLFASSTTGDLVANTGVAFNVGAITRPFVEIGGIISLRTNTIDARIAQDQRRIDNMERQLASREADLRLQYGRMEAAFSRMEQMSNSFDNFNQMHRNNNR